MLNEDENMSAIRRAKNDAYTRLLSISLIALICSCALLYFDYSQYGTQKPPAAPASTGR